MTTGAVILAAGFGTRLAPITDHTPKPLIEVAGRPIASHLLDALEGATDPDSIVVVVNDQHHDAWRRWSDANPTVTVLSNGVTEPEHRLGAVADLRRGLAALEGCDWIVVLGGDNLLDDDLSLHCRAARANDMPVVLCRDLGADVPPGRFGEITTDDDGVVTRFREKPADPTSPLAATCSYVLPSDAMAWIDDYLADGGDADSPGGFIGWLAQRTAILARPITGRYFDIGNHDTLAQARDQWPL